MSAKLFPSKQAEFADWLENLATKVAAAPAAVGVSVAQAALLTDSNTAFQAAFTAAIEPSTRTRSAILAKAVAMKDSKRTAKQIADIVRAYPSITPSLLTDLGIPVPGQRQPVPPPSAMAQVLVESTGPSSVKVRIVGSGTPRRGKPAGSAGCIVMSYVGPTAPDDSRLWTMEGATSKTVFEVNLPENIAPGSFVWLAASFVNSKLEPGPMTYPPVKLRVAGRVTSASEENAIKLAA